MNNKKGIRKGIGIALVAIMIASIFALVVPTAVASNNPSVPEDYYPNSTIRIYGDVCPMGNAPERYSDWTQPFDPTIIPKDSITFNPAYLDWDMSAQSTDTNEKTYLRAWYEPCGKYWGPRKNHTYPTINLEYTYMYVDKQDKMPWHGSAGDSTFAFPICEIENQTGLGAFENTFEKPLSMAATPNLVNLSHVSGNVNNSYNKTVDGMIAIQKKYFIEPGEIIQFLDHKLEYVGTDVEGNFGVVRVWYVGNAEDDSAKLVILPKCETKYFKRHNEMDSSFSEDYPWFAHFEFKMQDTHLMAIDVGRYLWNCSVFYVDGVRYDVTAVEVLDWDGNETNGAEKFKYITLRTKLPKGTGEVMDESRVSSQYIDCIEKKEILPVLPPFNMNHSIVDDIDVPLWAPLKNLDKWPNGDPKGAIGTEKFPCAEKYVTMQYPPAQWLKFFRAVPIGVPGIPSDWQLWDNYGGPFYPGDDLPPYWVMDVCGKQLPAPEEGNYTVFDPMKWIAMDVEARIIPDVEPLVVYYIAEAREQRFSTNLLEKLNESYIGTSSLYENWTKFDIQTLPDMYTEFVLPEIPDVNASWRIINEPEPRKMLDEYGMFYGDYLITTSLIAPNSWDDRPVRGGDFPSARVAFSYDMREGMDGIDLYVNSDAKDTTKNVTLRIYGDVIADAYPTRYDNWEEPFNPTVIKKGSITFDTAKLEWDGNEYPMSAQSTDADLKEYLRAWYEPCYNFSKGKKPAVVTETTYMLLDHQDEKPWHGSANDTWFVFPIAENESTEQIGLELFENEEGMPATPNLVKLALVSALDDPVGAYNKSVKGKIRLEKKYYLEGGHEETVQFFDHKVQYLGTNEGGTIAVLRVGYAGNKDDDTWAEVHVPQGQTVWLDRHQNIYSGPQHKVHPVSTFYIRFEFKMQDTHIGVIDIGKELEWCDVFYVDGVRYEVMAIEVLDLDGDDEAEKFKYITLKTPFAKGTGTFDDSSADPEYGESSIYISKIPSCNPIPVLPPMSMEHLIVDDTDVVFWQPLKHLDKWPKGDPNGVPGKEFFPCAERYLTMQYPPYPWLKFFRAVPIDTDRDMQPLMPTDWEIWENYGGPFYPGDEVPDNWTLCKCGIKMERPDTWTVFDNEHWIANDVNERVIGPIGPLEFCWLNETKEPRYSTNLLQILNENITDRAPVEEGWTKYDIQTLPDMYTEFKLPVIPSVKLRVYIGGDYQDYFKPDMREYLGSYLITTSFWAPNAEGDFNLNQTYQQGNRYAFTFNASDGVGIYLNEDPPADPPECGWRFELKEGKDYVSLPAIPADASPDAVFGVDVEVKGYDTVTGWYTPTALEGGKGYLIRCAEPKTKDVNGTNVVGRTWANIKAELQSGGWNLVGVGDTDVTIGDNVVVIGWDAVKDQWVTLHKGEEMERGKGYWIEWPQ